MVIQFDMNYTYCQMKEELECVTKSEVKIRSVRTTASLRWTED